MLVLLPPSESKTGRSRGKPLEIDSLSFPSLAPQRREVIEALARVSARPDAHEVLGVSPNLTEEVARNTVLDSAPAVPAAQVYSGVLYDALDLGDLTPGQRRRANRWLVVVSALFGAVRPKDRIPPYRLSMAVNLPGMGPLASHWREALEAELTEAAGSGLVVDARSSTYAAAWTPGGETAKKWVHIRVPGATHMAKHTRGLVVRQLLSVDREPRTPTALARALEPAFEVSLTKPARTGRPWVLDATAR
ncbi:YaaA family protein [Janibacter corallicola]|uniref:YaaA family protein n=1 Tax=Janibacter corallicola TaxID=415212 RepID=UPI00082B70F9|nr:peroxide stress protein YaaA [Janibacter corallicola]